MRWNCRLSACARRWKSVQQQILPLGVETGPHHHLVNRPLQRDRLRPLERFPVRPVQRNRPGADEIDRPDGLDPAGVLIVGRNGSDGSLLPECPGVAAVAMMESRPSQEGDLRSPALVGAGVAVGHLVAEVVHGQQRVVGLKADVAVVEVGRVPRARA